VSQAVVVGNRRKYATVLIVPNFENLLAWAREKGLPVDDREALLEHPTVRELYAGVLEGINRGKASFETLKDFRLLPSDFTIDGGELTPTLKVKRRVVEDRYADLIGTMYEDEVPARL
jgi:long-chain acyl-CoA synthetase